MSINLSYNQLNTIAIVQCDEDYINLKETHKPLFDQLADLSKSKQFKIGDKIFEIDLFVGGDMTFLQILLGLGGSTGDFACPWCKVHKNDRYDMSKEWNFYHSSEFFRSADEICFLSSQNRNKYGVKHKPLLNIEVDHFLPDELHLMLRITDVLLRNVIFDVLDKDDKAKKQGLTSTNLDDFVTLVQSCGVSFHVWTPKGSTEIEWSSLTGLDKIKVLKSLPEKLLESDTVNTDTKKGVVKLWTDFYSVYKFVNSDDWCRNI